jgi:hypothetical protein
MELYLLQNNTSVEDRGEVFPAKLDRGGQAKQFNPEVRTSPPLRLALDRIEHSDKVRATGCGNLESEVPPRTWNRPALGRGPE